MEVERQALKSRGSGKDRRKTVRVSGLELSPELVAIALGVWRCSCTALTLCLFTRSCSAHHQAV